ncbi:MAG TPA: DUF58 domain-containing protein [Lachnospiraceae bacterium]|nr:DUF58 domain-containing protein [Lachnospiraceae bacterium]
MKISRIVYLVFLIGIFIYAAFWGGRISYAILYLLLVIPIFSLFYILFVNIRMRFLQNAGTRKIVKLQTAPYEFKLQNESLWGFAKIKVFFNTDTATLFPLESEKEYSLPPNSKFREEAELICRYCGTYSVGIDSFAITDYFGLFTIRFPLFSKLSVTVLPRIIPWTYGDLLNPDEDEKRQGNQALFQEEMDAELRPYMPGDPLKKIHWKASAKQQKLMVHKYINIQRQEILIFPDFSKINASKEEVYRQQDLILELLLSLCNEGLNSGLPVQVNLCDDKMKQQLISDKKDFDLFYEYLSTINFSAKKPIAKVLESCLLHPLQNKQVFVLASCLTKDLSLHLLKMLSDAKKITLILTAQAQSETGAKLIKQLVQKGIYVKEVSIS